MATPVMASAFHIGCVVTLIGIKDARYADPASRWTVVRYNTNTSRWSVKLSCGSQPEIAVREANMMLESAGAASVPEALVPWRGSQQTADAIIMNIPWIERGSQPDGEWIPLPGARGSEVRLVHALPGHGLLFFNWGNFRRLQNPAADEYTLEFRNVGACGPGVCTQ